MERLTANQFAHLWHSGRVRTGDVLLFDRRGVVSGVFGFDLTSALIRRVQGRLLQDLGVEETRLHESWFSHAAVAGDGFYSSVLEMTSPRARALPASQIPPGSRVMVRRPRLDGEDISREMGRKIADAAWRDIGAGRRYPYWELLYWVWSWSWRKLRRRQRFADVFRSDRADVCSGSVWRWCLEAGLFREVSDSDRRPEAWYPARLAAEADHFRTVEVFELR